jgi:hypothetical protein
MMRAQARSSVGVMGFDTHMILDGRACTTSDAPRSHNTQNRTNPYLDEALGSWGGACRSFTADTNAITG